MFIVVSGHENDFKLQRSSIYCFFLITWMFLKTPENESKLAI